MRTFTSFTTVLVAALLFAGCGGGGSSGGSSGSGGTPPPSGSETGEVTLAVTDAPTDEIDTLEVDIVSFRFVKRNGAVVEVLPQTVRVDFADLVSVSQVIAGATLPVGDYPRAFMTLDFATAAARISGNPGLAALKDGSGTPLVGREELEIVFPGGGFTVGPRKGYFAVVDFDLDQSLSVDATANTITIDSVLYADIDPAQPKDTRAPGLASGFTGASFQLDVRLGLGLMSRGKLTVNTDSTTVFDLDGQVLQGQAGFDALALLGDGTLVAVEGRVDPLARTLAARRVLLLPQDLDEVEGLVVARSGGAGQDAVLTLRGVSVRRAAGSVTLNDLVTLSTSFVATKVNKRAVAAGALSTDAINVGQRLLAYGKMAGSTLDLTQPGAGFVRLVETGIGGAVTQAASGGRLTLDVTRIGARRVAAFDFTVGGAAVADPRALVVDVASLGGAVPVGAPVWVRGFFPPVSAGAGDADFLADALIDRSNAGSLLRVWWLIPNATPLAARAGAEATIDVSAATQAHVDQGLIVPVALASNPAVAGQASGFYAIRQGLRVTLFRDPAAFWAQLEADLQGGGRGVAFRSFGRWDAAAGRMDASRAVAIIR